MSDIGNYKYDPSHAQDYSNPDEFYDDHYDEFDCYAACGQQIFFLLFVGFWFKTWLYFSAYRVERGAALRSEKKRREKTYGRE